MKKALFYLFTCMLIFSCGKSPHPHINRYDLVNRHNVKNTSIDSLASLTVGNGDFAFTVDITGLQSFPSYYKNGIPLGRSQTGDGIPIPTPKGIPMKML
jgi:hypothetical protein